MVVPYDISEEGGVKRHAFHLAEALRRGGDHVEIAAPLRSGDASIHVQGFGGVLNVPANGADNHMALLTPPWSVARFMHRGHFDVVHVHEPMVPVLPWYALWMGNGAARVSTFHMYAEREIAASRAARAMLARALYPSLHAGIAVSDAAAEYAGRYWRRPITVIPNGVPTARFRPPAPAPRAPGVPLRLLFVGNWRDPRKGLPVLLDACRELYRRGVAVTLDVVGKGTSTLDLSGLPGVTVHGVVDGEEALIERYQACDVFVSPATGKESFGIVLLEAMACGRPVVCSDIRGYRDAAREGGARFVRPGDAGAFADALESLARAPELRAEMGARHRRHAERYDWSEIAEAVREVYVQARVVRLERTA
jgi:phosphatidylinositol alpha-mannosyltransferase